MKKIIVFALVLALSVAALSSCAVVDKVLGLFKGETDIYTEAMNRYYVSEPTKVVATTKQTIGALELDCSYELITGFVDNVPASVYTVATEEIRSVEDGGNNEEVKDIIISTVKKTEAVEGLGSRTNGGEWNPLGTVWKIGRGRMAINISEENVQNAVYENNVFTCTVPADKVVAVLGEDYAADVAGDVEVKIFDDGAVVTVVELHYFLKGDESINLPESEMDVKIVYTYDLERITIE
ncbi:MAG: hypothetical protein IJW02_06450 [Clostridia bacterium]|nr:hypothetical protein [Clostridia bacterium]